MSHKVMFSDQPGIEFPAWLRNLGFTDESSRNEAWARATVQLGDRFLDVCVTEENPSERECGPKSRRYTLFIGRNDGSAEVFLMETDSDETAKQFIAAVMDGRS